MNPLTPGYERDMGRDLGRIADALEALLELGRWYTSGDRSTLDVLAVKLDETQQWGERVRRLAEHAILRIDAVERKLGWPVQEVGPQPDAEWGPT